MEDRNLRKVRVGLVVSNKMDKTVTVAIADNVKHPIYGLVHLVANNKSDSYFSEVSVFHLLLPPYAFFSF